ncbi:hypothetical protein [Burkholderia gladioli]|uniref:hypothetical protein n=1 Tax=Burkholderia gladioli TaxID=28095 RepID=UPI0016408279|nr:hypothetical protein [Burkholderia gladioli]
MTSAQFHYRGYDVSIQADAVEPDDLGPQVIVGVVIVCVSDGEIFHEEPPIRMLPAGVVITPELAIEYRADEARRRIDVALK